MKSHALCLLCLLLFLGCSLSAPPVGDSLLAAPVDLRTSAASATSIRISWAPVNGAEGYSVFRSGGETGDFTKINAADVLSSPYEDAGLSPNTVYWYRVAALKGGREQKRSSAFSGSTNLEAPGNIVVNASAPGELEVTWETVGGAEGYNLYRSDFAAGMFLRRNPAPVSQTTYRDGALRDATTYWYKVAAIKGGAEQDPSNPVSGATMLGAPMNLKVSYLSPSSLRVSWQKGPG